MIGEEGLKLISNGLALSKSMIGINLSGNELPVLTFHLISIIY